jgi:nucleoside-diphosphate-sugar epimerase
MRVLVIGCGYVGLPLAEELVRRGDEVLGVCRSDGPFPPGIHGIACDITQREQLKRLPAEVDSIINMVSSTKGGAEEYRAVYYEASREVLSRVRCSKYIFTSSTSVYGQTDGSVVTETSAVEPASPTSRILREAEELVLKSHPCALVLRVAGIYGPERGHLFLQYLRGEARIHGKGDRILNMIHRDDVVGATLAVLDRGRGEIYNVADNEPPTELEFFEWLAARLKRELPPRVSDAELASRKRGVTSKRVSNEKLRKQLGYEFKYPTFREGYTAEMKRLGL